MKEYSSHGEAWEDVEMGKLKQGEVFLVDGELHALKESPILYCEFCGHKLENPFKYERKFIHVKDL